MRKRGATVEYLYWSARRTARFVDDNGLVAPTRQVAYTISSPSLSWAPTLSRLAKSSGGLRPQIATAIERALGKIAVMRFNSPAVASCTAGPAPSWSSPHPASGSSMLSC
jgi:hypothetical protein